MRSMGTTLTITAKGQVTLKKEVLDHLGVGPGDKVEVDFVAPGRVEVRALPPDPSGWDAFIGCLKAPAGPILSIEEINEITQQGWAGEIKPEP